MDAVGLRKAISNAGVTNRWVSAQIEISEQALYNKINGVTEFKASEIKRLAKVLSLSRDDINKIFFDDV